jgi:YD repeat-containing protein
VRYLADSSLAGWNDASGRHSAVAYGSDQVTVTTGFGDATTYRFTTAGEVASAISPAGITTERYTYDARHRVVTEIDWLGGVTSYQYNAQDDVTRSPIATARRRRTATTRGATCSRRSTPPASRRRTATTPTIRS